MHTLEENQMMANLLGAWRENPIVRHYAFSDKKLWGKQEDILWAIRKHRRVAVKSANTCGKSFIAADVVLDFLITNKDAVVVTTAPTFHQVETILWREIRDAVLSAKIKLQCDLLQTELKISNKWYAVGISVDNPVNFQGKHSASGKLLVVIDESCGVDAEIWDMVEALHPSNILAISNPLDGTGKFFDCFHSDLWHKITISAQDAINWQNKHGKIPGLVTLEWVNDMAQMHGKNSDWYRVHVDGEFPMQEESALISREWVDRARKGLDADGMLLAEEDEQRTVRIVGCDVATKHGENLTVIGYRYGHTVTELKGYPKATMTFSRDQIQSLYSKTEAHMVVSDADGVGESMAEILAESHVPCTEYHGGYGAKPMGDVAKFRNMRSQFHWLVAKKFEKGLYDLSRLDDKAYELLKSQLCSIKVKPADALGRFQIETKEDMQARGLKSPDYSDCFVMMEMAYYTRKFVELKPFGYGGL